VMAEVVLRRAADFDLFDPVRCVFHDAPYPLVFAQSLRNR
jgi:hypothetical protein